MEFVKRNEETGEIVDAWNVQASGDYEADVKAGRRHAKEIDNDANFSRDDLDQVFKAIVLKGQWTGVEEGFFSGVDLLIY
jgi:hypothetical protein